MEVAKESGKSEGNELFPSKTNDTDIKLESIKHTRVALVDQDAKLHRQLIQGEKEVQKTYGLRDGDFRLADIAIPVRPQDMLHVIFVDCSLSSLHMRTKWYSLLRTKAATRRE